jgi:glycosyltransferase involved in cell wall biosynthesis
VSFVIHSIAHDKRFKVTEKMTILTLSDSPLAPSGVGTQTNYMIHHLLKTGKYKFVSLGGAIKHQDYKPIRFEEWGDDWIIIPVDGYGTPDQIRSLIRTEKVDAVWFMTDPRFWGWLWEIEDEVRPICPMIYYHVWDNYPFPKFNEPHYSSNDVVATISKVTDDIVRNVSPGVECVYIPHAVPTETFKPFPEDIVENLRKDNFGPDKDKFICFWNNRNARRKQSGTLIYWWKKFLDRVGHDKAKLVMHTDVRDPYGQNLQAIIESVGLVNGEVVFSQNKVDTKAMAAFYNMVDVTVNIADAEGFGLGTLESLSCETPIIVTMTGGLQEQVTDGKEWFGIGLKPSSKAVIGSQEIPYIYEDRVNEDDFVDALEKIYNMSSEDRKELGKKGRKHVLKNYSFEQYSENWDNLFQKVRKERGSWDTRKGYKTWTLKEVI